MSDPRPVKAAKGGTVKVPTPAPVVSVPGVTRLKAWPKPRPVKD